MASQNRDLKATWNYHNGTKHSYESVRTNRHYLDWDNQPLPYKIYRGLDPIPLADDVFSAGVSALAAAGMLPFEVTGDNEPVQMQGAEAHVHSNSCSKIRTCWQMQLDGKYVIKDLPAGEYLLAAVTDVDQDEWQDSAFLDRLQSASVKLTIAEGEKRTLDLRIGG